MLKMKSQKEKLMKQHHSLSHQKNKVPRNKTKEVKDFTLKAIRHFWNKPRWHNWKDIPCSWIGRISLLKMTILPKAIYPIQCNSYRYQWCCSHNKNKIFKIYMDTQKTLNSQSNIEKEKYNWWNQAPWFQSILKSYSH